MASDTKATSHKEDLPEKETPESAPDRPLLDFSDAAVKKAPPHRQETRLGPPPASAAVDRPTKCGWSSLLRWPLAVERETLAQ